MRVIETVSKNRKPNPRGATPIAPKKVKKEWNISLPSMPTIAWRWLLLPFFSGLLMFAAHWVYTSTPVSAIEFNGTFSVWSAEQLTEPLVWVKNESFFSLDVKKVHQQLQALPLIKHVSVRKQWPSTVQVTISEDVPIALWNNDKVLSASGKISGLPVGLPTDDLIQMSGAGQQTEQVVRYYRRLQQVLNDQKIRVLELNVSTVGSVEAKLSNGWHVKLGRQYIEERVERLDKILRYIPQEKVAIVDLRYGKGAAIRWREQQEIG